MAFLSGFVRSGLSLFGKESASFPYSVGAKVEWFDEHSIWSLHQGTKKEDGSDVSIFMFDCNKQPDKVQLARNAFKRMRTMRHPDLLRYVDGIETEQAIMFVTDPVEPLSNQLNQNPNDLLLLWGLYKVANALKFLNCDCDMVHGNVNVSSIFTNDAGEWKLGGFEVLSSMKEESPFILSLGGITPKAHQYMTPEVKKSGWTVIKNLPTTATDSYHLGCLIYETYNHHFDSTEKLLSHRGNIPTTMYSVYRELLSTAPGSRADAGTFLDEGMRPGSFFTNDFIDFNVFLENISIKEQREKEAFFNQLDNSIDTFPTEFATHKILPELLKAFEFGSGGAKALNAILKIGQHLDTEQYAKMLVEPIVRMFASPDRAIRISLLENMPKFIDHIPNKTVTNQVFPNVATGFTDTVPIIREQTIKSILYLVPKLSERVINYDLLKYLAKLQVDEEPGIRTNTTICLGKIARNLSDATRKKILVPAFTRGLRDGFHHARIAALMALMATVDTYDIQECSSRIVPAISLVLIDKEKSVRTQAFKTIQAFISRIEEYANTMPEEAPPPPPQSSSPSTVGASNGDSAAANAQVGSLSMSGVFGEATKGLAGWAVSSIGARFGTPSGEIADPGQSPTYEPYRDTNTPPQPGSDSVTRLSSTTQPRSTTPLRDMNGWDDDNIMDNFDNADGDGWEPLDTLATNEPEPITSVVPNTIKPANAVSSFGASTDSPGIRKAGEPFKLSTATSQAKSSVLSKDEKRAEMERRREERRQRMAELREKKKGGIGAKKI